VERPLGFTVPVRIALFTSIDVAATDVTMGVEPGLLVDSSPPPPPPHPGKVPPTRSRRRGKKMYNRLISRRFIIALPKKPSC